MSELIFIAGMFVLILFLCTGAMIVFARQFKTEMRDKRERAAAKKKQAEPIAEAPAEKVQE